MSVCADANKILHNGYEEKMFKYDMKVMVGKAVYGKRKNCGEGNRKVKERL